MTNYLGLLQAIYRGKDFLSPLVFSPLFQYLPKALGHLHTSVVGAEVGENCTPQPVTADVTTATQCDSCGHVLQSLHGKLFTSATLRFKSLKLVSGSLAGEVHKQMSFSLVLKVR